MALLPSTLNEGGIRTASKPTGGLFRDSVKHIVIDLVYSKCTWLLLAFLVGNHLTLSTVFEMGYNRPEVEDFLIHLESQGFNILLSTIDKVVEWSVILSLFVIVIFVLTEIALPMCPTYCYTCAIHHGYRLSCVRIFGCNPQWSDVRGSTFLDHTKLYKLTVWKCDVHHLETDPDGVTLEEITKNLGEVSRVGYSYKVPRIEILLKAQPGLRLLLIVYALFMYGEDFPILALGTLGLGLWFSLDFGLLGSLVCLGYWDQEPKLAIIAGVITYISSVGFLNLFPGPAVSKWTKMANGIPSIKNYPIGLPASGKSHEYNLHSKNNSYETRPFHEPNMSQEVREEFARQTGSEGNVHKPSGNPHKEGAAATSYLIYQLVEFMDPYDFIINVGGTFRGLPTKVAGLALQPTLSDADGANFLNHGSDVGLGRMVVNDHLATNVGPVGVNDDFDPGWGVTGLEGAIITMIHVYDVPIKALLGVAYVNQSKSVYTILHADPEMFRGRSGQLRWTGQNWEHNNDGTITYEWPSTPGRVFNHNFRIIYEHLFTDYVKVGKDAWYVGTIHRSIFDVFMVRWTLQSTKPIREEKRTLTIRTLRSQTLVPALEIGNFLTHTVHMVPTDKVSEEYMINAKTPTDMNISLRAVTDNTYRSSGDSHEHTQTHQIKDLFLGQQYAKDLSKLIADSHKPMKHPFALLGLMPDGHLIGNAADKLYDTILNQPATEVICETLCQETAYVNPTSPVAKRPRVYRMENYQTQGGIVAQDVLDEKVIKQCIKLRGAGDDMMKQMCHVLFGHTAAIRSILPCGLPQHGGSDLVELTTNLLPTEIEFLVSELNLQILVERDEGVCLFGNIEKGARPPIVYVDLVNRVVSRVHYPGKAKVEDVISKFGADPSDLANDQDWIDLMYPPRAVVREYEYAGSIEKYMEVCNAFIEEEVQKDGRRRGNDNFDPVVYREVNVARAREAFRQLEVPDGFSKLNDVPNLPQPMNCELYDREHLINGKYLPPHLYAHLTVLEMRMVSKGGVG